MNLIKIINDCIRFLLELVIIASLCYCGLSHYAPFILKLAIGILLPLVIIIIWACYVAPKANQRLNLIPRIVMEVVIFFISVIAIYFSGLEQFAISLAIVVLINSVIIHLA